MHVDVRHLGSEWVHFSMNRRLYLLQDSQEDQGVLVSMGSQDILRGGLQIVC